MIASKRSIRWPTGRMRTSSRIGSRHTDLPEHPLYSAMGYKSIRLRARALRR